MNTTTGYQAAADQQTLLIHGEMELAGDSRPVMFVVRVDTFSPEFRAELAKLGLAPLAPGVRALQDEIERLSQVNQGLRANLDNALNRALDRLRSDGAKS